MNKNSIYEQRKRDRNRLLKIKKLHKEYNAKVGVVLDQIKEIKKMTEKTKKSYRKGQLSVAETKKLLKVKNVIRKVPK